MEKSVERMKIIFFLICVLFNFQLGQTLSKPIGCEIFEIVKWNVSIGSVRRCNMKLTTTIDSNDVSISPSDASIFGLDFNGNTKISFLPIEVDETFPNLIGYHADSCSLKTVLKINFKNLAQLKHLSLSHNQIERLDNNTFEDLTSLEHLILGYNKIKQINGAAFSGLERLKEVWLNENICIHEIYIGETAIHNSLVKDVDEKCPFSELDHQNEQTKENKTQSNGATTLNSQIAIVCFFACLLIT